MRVVKQSTAKMQRSQMVKSLFTMWSRGQAAKVTVQNFELAGKELEGSIPVKLIILHDVTMYFVSGVSFSINTN